MKRTPNDDNNMVEKKRKLTDEPKLTDHQRTGEILTDKQRSVVAAHLRLNVRIRNIVKIRTILIEEMHTKKFHESRSGRWIPKSTDPFEKLAYHKLLFWGQKSLGDFPCLFKSKLEDQMLSEVQLPTTFDYTKVYYGGDGTTNWMPLSLRISSI